MVFFPECKINLGLDILRRREDCYHEIETVMFPVRGLCDILEVVPAERDGVEFSSGGLTVDCRTTDNLCYKAYLAVAARYNIPGVKIHLHKIIPFGAGLGGGSSDAVSTIKALSKIFSLGISQTQTLEIASELGSDTAFFVDGTPALCSGRGEVLRPVNVDSLQGYVLMIVKPDFGVSTAAAYSSVVPSFPEVPLAERIKLPVWQWRNQLKNDFESPVFSEHPRLAKIKEDLYLAGAVYASMSGSGSAMFGIFENDSFPASPKDIAPDCFVYHEVIS